MYAPIIPLAGYPGWTFLQKTAARQKAVLNKSPELVRDIDHFRAKIGKVRTADELVGDRRLLSVALTAFGLEGDINNKAFIRKILAEGTQKDTAFANRLADKRYLEFSRAFALDTGEPNTGNTSFVEQIVAAYQARSWETAVGGVNNDLRLGLNAQRELATIAASGSTSDTKWLSVLASPPLRNVIQGAFGLPSSFASVDLDTQMSVLRKRSQQIFGSSEIEQFKDPANMERLVKLFLVRSQASLAPTSSAAMALGLLRG
jgi:hypothetical protein